MAFRVYKDRRGVSGIFAGIFMLIVFLLIIATHVLIQAQQRMYDQAVEERNQRDLERLNERIEIIWARVELDVLNITVRNYGGVTAHLVDVWIRAYDGLPPENPLGQSLYEISIWIEPGHIASFSPPGSFDDSLKYGLKIVTERGNIVSVQAPYPPFPEGGGGGLGFYPIIIEADEDNFQFRDIETPSGEWEYAWIKDRSNPKKVHVLYRVLVNNTTDMTIILDASTVMVQSAGTMSEVERMIVSTGADPNDPLQEDYPKPFEYQIIPPKKLRYIYFAADPETGEWCADPNIPYCPVSFLINFRFFGDPDLLTLGLPVQVMRIE